VGSCAKLTLGLSARTARDQDAAVMTGGRESSSATASAAHTLPHGSRDRTHTRAAQPAGGAAPDQASAADQSGAGRAPEADAFGNRIADTVTRFAGSMTFVYLHVLWFGCWIGFGVESYPWEGGSHVIAMRWVHELDAFESLPVAEQQRVFGRTKADSAELAPAEKPPTAPIARVETSEGGRELEIFRRSVPYGTAREHGLYFVAFSAERSRYDRMLARMFGTAGDGVHDRLTDFSHPVSGAHYFAPSLTVLNEIADSDRYASSPLTRVP
jgi:Dyp-type peroxidase family